MVAGRRFWGEEEQRSTQHHSGRGGELRVKALDQDGLCTGEAGELGVGVETRRSVDDENDGGAKRAQQEDQAPRACPAPAGGEQGEGRGEQGDRDQHIGMGIDRGLEADFRGARHPRQAGVARLTDLDTAIVDELRGDQRGGRGDDHGADRPLWGEYGTGPGRHRNRACDPASGRTLDQPERAQEEDRQRSQPPPAPAQHSGRGTGGRPKQT